MARALRVDIAGYYYISNSGFGTKIVFKDADDYRKFLQILAENSDRYGAILHSYALVPKSFSMLLELKENTLSKLMHQLNSRYALYFNRKYKRSGHLWRSRFYSLIIQEHSHICSILRLIEQSPLKLKNITDIQRYPYSSYRTFIGLKEPISSLDRSILFQKFSTPKEIAEFFQTSVSKDLLKEIKRGAVKIKNRPKLSKNIESLQTLFTKIESTKERNNLIAQAYIDGYSQYQIAKAASLSQPTISLIIKRYD